MKHCFTSLLLTFVALFATLPAQTYTGGGGAIPDDGTVVEFPLTVSGLSPSTIDTSTFGLETVCLTIMHPYDSDLRVMIVSPDGTDPLLFDGVGGSGNNFLGTCLNAFATTSIGAGSPPFSGTFRPSGLMGKINNGQNGNGVWKLRILDTYPFADAGTLVTWSITFGSNPATWEAFKGSNLPLVLVNTGGTAIPDGPKITADMKVIDNGPGGYNRPTDVPAFEGKIGISIRGSYSASLPQKPYSIETRDVMGASLDTSLLGMPSENDWILLANYNDKVFCRNTLAFELFRRMGHYAPRTRLCEVLVNDEYVGIYVFTERIKRDDNRVAIKKLDSLDVSGIDVTGGYIIKSDYFSSGDSWLSPFHPIDHPSLDVHFVYHYPEPDDILPIQQFYISNYWTAFESRLYSTTWDDPITGYRAYIDVPSFIDYMFVNEFARNTDGFRKSCYYHKDREDIDNLIHAGPVWDFDWAYKNMPGCSIFAATDGSGWAYKVNDCFPDVNSPGWLVRLFDDPAFQNEVKCRWQDFEASVMDTTWIFQYVDSIAALVDTAQQRHYERWPILGINVGSPEVDPQPTTFEGDIDKFKQWIRVRYSWLDANWPGTCLVATQDPHPDGWLRIFPNPTSQWLWVESQTEIVSVRCMDIAGRLAFQLDGAAIRNGIDVSALPSGSYLLTVERRSGASHTQRIEIQR